MKVTDSQPKRLNYLSNRTDSRGAGTKVACEYREVSLRAIALKGVFTEENFAVAKSNGSGFIVGD